MDSSTHKAYLLFDVGGTFLKAGAASDNTLLAEAEFSVPMPSDGTLAQIREGFSQAVAEGYRRLQARGLQMQGIGIAMPGPFDYGRGISLMRHKFAALYGLSLTELLRGLPHVGEQPSVRYLHDVVAVLRGEMATGAARGCRDVAVVTLGTGLGFACARQGQIQYGPLGSPAESIYNQLYKEGVLEDFVSKRGFLRAYADACGHAPAPSLTVADLADLANRGDVAATRAFSRTAEVLAEGLRPRLSALQTECLLLGGQISRSFALLQPALQQGLRDLPALRCIARVEHISSAPFYGLLAALQE